MEPGIMKTHQEKKVKVLNGWMMLGWQIVLPFIFVPLFIYSLPAKGSDQTHPDWPLFVLSILLLLFFVISMVGFFTLQPNEARVLILFGKYVGTVKESGFHWGNPFYSNGPVGTVSQPETGTPTPKSVQRPKISRFKVSLRVRTLNGEKLKVNDKRGNPIEIAAVVVWRVEDTAHAIFDVDRYEDYVRLQTETAVRHLASCYAYDHGEEDEITLRSGVDDVSKALQRELQERLSRAGVMVEEARLTHLAYAPEIAQAMLRRQQAEAVIAARQKIVHGAVSMVEMALKDLADKHVVQLDDERRAAMVSNLMVVLCGESEVHPVINAGTLYN
ncbi:MAG TPA: SPFH domain-containing protein [Terriglobia bacterium]|nr:SPFH domain-containing protein [Terriglobia bacterium]